MISFAIFPCRFTDSARVLGELSYTLSIPVYTDQMILTELADQLDRDIGYLKKRLFGWANRAGCAGMEKNLLIDAVQDRINSLQTKPDDHLYYGFFTSLIGQSSGLPHRLLIYSEEDRRVARGMRMEKLTHAKALKIVREHDRKATCWTRFLFDRDPYDPALFDTVVMYENQDLFDVVSYICIIAETDALQNSQHQTGSIYYT